MVWGIFCAHSLELVFGLSAIGTKAVPRTTERRQPASWTVEFAAHALGLSLLFIPCIHFGNANECDR